MSVSPPRHTARLAVAELALAAVSGAVLYSFVRLFDDTAFFATLVPVVVYAHAVTTLLRRTGVGLVVTTVVSSVGFALLATWLWFPETSTALLPTPATWEALTSSLEVSWESFRQLTAPVPVETGFLVATGTVLFLAIFLADWAAFRLWSPLEAIVPAFALYLFSILLGSETQQIGTAVVFAATVGAFTLSCRIARLEATSGWSVAENRQGSGWLARVGACAMAAAVAAGVLLGPVLPGTGEAALVDWRNRDEQSNRIVVSPLVEIRNRLVQQSSQEAFTVRSPQPAYWRLTALDTFDGSIWRSGGRYSQAEGALDAIQPDAVHTEMIEQSFEIMNLAATWLPAAYQAVAIEVLDTKVRHQADSATLIVDNEVLNSDDLAYRVLSALPRPTAEQLDRPDVDVPDRLRHQLELPDSLSDQVPTLAEEVVAMAGAETMYERAIALQSFFRDEGPFADDGYEFTYTLNPPTTGHSGDAIVDFLTSGQGYCEQFAGTYAAMARSVGLPTRVAVGFSWGEPEPEDPDLYVVRGRHALAWPEVWLGDDVGWVAFEPTPGRGSPSMVDYAGVAPSQAGASADPTVTETIEVEGLPGADDQGASGAPVDEVEEPEAGAGDLATSFAASSESDTRGWPAAFTVAGLVALGLMGLYLVAAPLLTSWERRRRRSLASDDAGARVQVAWQESEEDLALVGVVRRPSETHDEFAQRAAGALSEQAANLDDLAEVTEAASYAPTPPSSALVARAEQAAGEIHGAVRETTGAPARLRASLNPRLVWSTVLRTAHSSRRKRSRMR